MRGYFFAAFFLIAGCTHDTAQETTRTLTSAKGDVLALEAWPEIKKQAVSLCLVTQPKNASRLCDFQLHFETSAAAKPNAKSWIGENGQANVSVTQSLLDMLISADEIAFVLAHEVAHAIAAHHGRFGQRNFAGGFTLSRAGSHQIELQADAIGAVISHRAGFDPVKGAALLKRLAPSSSKSHPMTETRLALVARTAHVLDSGAEIEFDVFD